jgi:hypothetical protein
MLNDIELKELHDEYFSISKTILKLEMRQMEIDHIINNNSKEKVASRFIPLEFGDKIRVTRKVMRGGIKLAYDITTHEGFFGSWVLDGHQYTKDDGVGSVKLRLYQIKKDGTRSQICDEFNANIITSIEKVEE